MFKPFRSLLILLLLLTCLPTFAQKTPQKPNIIFILADDLGYGDLGVYGQKDIKTPNLDRMAREGMRFTQFYSGSTVCAPSRCVLMTGKHTGRAYIRGNGRLSLRTQDEIVAERMKKAGYQTAVIGKWGLGELNNEGHPNRKGFDYFFGYLNHTHAHNTYPSHLFRNSERVALKNVVPNEGGVGQGMASEKVEFSNDLFAEEALRYVEQNKSNPFFLYLCFTIPHANNEAGQRGMEVPELGIYANKDWQENRKAHAAMISRMDGYLGRLFETLKTLKLEKNTLIFFSSDNGSHKEGGYNPLWNSSSGPLRGHKRDLYEGGIRVPFLARWVGTIRAGSVTNQTGSFDDLLPTLAELVGQSVGDEVTGVSILPTLLNRPKQQKQRAYLYWEFYEQGSSRAIRIGDWKGVCKPFHGAMELYDLKSDLGESKNIAADHPEIVARLRAAMQEAHIPSPDWKLPAGKSN